MITVRRAGERHHDQGVWLTFFPQSGSDALSDRFGVLDILNEGRLRPDASVPRHALRDAEIVTYVYSGALAHEESTGLSGVIQAGEFQRMNVGRGTSHLHTNPSRSDSVHFFQIWLRASEVGLEQSHEERRFSVANRRGVLCVITSPDGRRGSLRTHQDAVIYSAILDTGQHVVHELAPGRSAWLHVVQGELSVGDVVLRAGDGAGVRVELTVAVTAREESELLLIDLIDLPPKVAPNGGVP